MWNEGIGIDYKKLGFSGRCPLGVSGMRINENLIVRKNAVQNLYLAPEETTHPSHETTEYIPVASNATYSMSKIDSALLLAGGVSNGYFRCNWYDEDKQYISRLMTTENAHTVTSPANAKFIRLSYPVDARPKFEIGTEVTMWVPNPLDLTESQRSTLPNIGWGTDWKEILPI